MSSKRPQVVGNKVTTNYVDSNSLVLKSYIDISRLRLSKVKAGAHLTSVLRSQQSPPSLQEQIPTQDSEITSRQQILTQHTEGNDNNKQFALSKFMENYLSQKGGVDPGVLMEKENNIYRFFKEKFGLMSKFLGEDILKEGLFLGSAKNEGQANFDKKKTRKIDIEGREQYLLDMMKNDGKGEGREGSSSKVLRINRDIMRQLLQEDHQKEMDELMKLQTEQNMQVFNDLQDLSKKNLDKKGQNRITLKTPPPKIILKNNFLRTSLEIDEEKIHRTEERDSPVINISFRKSTQAGRPFSEQLVFRTIKKKEQLLPNVAAISNMLDAHKFQGSQSHAPSVDSVSYRSQGAERVNHLSTENQASEGNLRARTAFTIPKLETPRIFVNNVSPGQTLSKFARLPGSVKEQMPATTKDQQGMTQMNQRIRGLISEEIEFLERQKETSQGKRPVESRQGGKRYSEKTSHFSFGSTELYKTQNGPSLSEIEEVRVFFPKTTSNHGFEKKFIERIPKARSNTMKKDGSLSGNSSKNSLMGLSPKPDMSLIRSFTRNSMNLKHVSSKRDAESVDSKHPLGKAGKKIQQIGSGKKDGGFTTKLVAVNKEELNISGTKNLTSHIKNPIASLDLAYNGLTPNTQKSSGADLKASFGTKYWKNNFD